jgi:hypothetical protein
VVRVIVSVEYIVDPADSEVVKTVYDARATVEQQVPLDATFGTDEKRS